VPVVEVPPQRLSLGRAEDKARFTRITTEMLAQQLAEGSRQRKGARAPSLGWLDFEVAVYLRHRLHDVDSSSQEVQPFDSQSGELTPPHPRIRGRVDEGPVTWLNRLCQSFDLVRIEEPHLLMRGLLRQVDTDTRRPGDEPVDHGRLEDLREGSVDAIDGPRR
jgi:hypothetical protein